VGIPAGFFSASLVLEVAFLRARQILGVDSRRSPGLGMWPFEERDLSTDIYGVKAGLLFQACVISKEILEREFADYLSVCANHQAEVMFRFARHLQQLCHPFRLSGEKLNGRIGIVARGL